MIYCNDRFSLGSVSNTIFCGHACCIDYAFSILDLSCSTFFHVNMLEKSLSVTGKHNLFPQVCFPGKCYEMKMNFELNEIVF